MADVKITGLTAGAAPFADTSVMIMSEDDTGFASVKVTVAQLKTLLGSDLAKVLDNGFTMDAEQKIVFEDDTSTSKVFLTGTQSTAALIVEAVETNGGMGFSGNGTSSYTGGFVKAEETFARVGFLDANISGIHVEENSVQMQIAGASVIDLDATGIGFFEKTPVAQPTGVAVTAGGIHAALVSLGLITA